MDASPHAKHALSRGERVFLLLLAGFMVASRLPFAGRVLHHWDSVQFALALRDYDVTRHQPHPPGYFLYVMLGRASQLLFPDANTALVAVSIVSGAVAAVLLYFLARSLYGTRAACAAALFFATSPVVWLYGEVALSDIVEGAAVSAVALLLWRARSGGLSSLLLATAVLGLAGGIRQQTLPLLLPLWLFCAWPHGLRRVLASIPLGILAVAVWLVPMLALSGGWHAYREACSQVWNATHGAAVVDAYGWQALPGNAALLIAFSLQALGLAMLPLVLGLLPRRGGAIPERSPKRRSAAVFLAFWILPAFLGYSVAVVNRAGILMTFYPALFIMAGAAVVTAASRLPESRRKPGLLLLAGLPVALNAASFLFAPKPPSAVALRNQDQWLLDAVAAVRRYCPPESTVISTQGQHLYRGFRLAAYYLPEYRVVEAGWEGRPAWTLGHHGRVSFGDQPPLPDRLEYLVLFDRNDGLPPELDALAQGRPRERLPLAGGGSLLCYRFGGKPIPRSP